MSFGTALKQAREAQGLTTQDLALRTKIRGDYLRALEDENPNLLPERTFARSYLQRYARELGLDPGPLLGEFDRSIPPAPEIAQSLRGNVNRNLPARSGSQGVSPGAAAGMATGLILLGAGAYWAYNNYFNKPARTVTPPPASAPAQPTNATSTPATTPAQPAPTSTVRLTVSTVPDGARVFLDNRDLGKAPVRSFPVDARTQAELRVEMAGRQPFKQTIALSQGRNLRVTLPAQGQGQSTLSDLNNPAAAPVASKPVAPPPAPKPAAAKTNAVSVTFTGESWTRIMDASGRVLYQGTPPVGSKKGFPTGVIIRAGNAGAVNVSVNGAPGKPMGQNGQVITSRF